MVVSMPRRLIATLVLVALLLGLFDAVPGWVSNVALVVLAGVVASLYVSRMKGRDAAR
jgi:ABC-type transporter Mla maintaining outer membrane lipid asymmetry permease subunit MlaE